MFSRLLPSWSLVVDVCRIETWMCSSFRASSHKWLPLQYNVGGAFIEWGYWQALLAGGFTLMRLWLSSRCQQTCFMDKNTTKFNGLPYILAIFQKLYCISMAVYNGSLCKIWQLVLKLRLFQKSSMLFSSAPPPYISVLVFVFLHETRNGFYSINQPHIWLPWM